MGGLEHLNNTLADLWLREEYEFQNLIIENIWDLEYYLSSLYSVNNLGSDIQDVIQKIVSNIGDENIHTVYSIVIEAWFCSISYLDNWVEKDFVYSIQNLEETFTSLTEALYLREREAQEIVTGFERHLDAMRQIFQANHESSQRWGEFIMNRWALNSADKFTSEMADGESQEFIGKTLLQIQEQARDEYMALLQFLESYPESALSPSLRGMIRRQIDTYTRMIMWVGIEYNWGAAHFRRKTEAEVRFGIIYGIEKCETVDELFDYYRSWHEDMSANWSNANDLTQRQSYPLVREILNLAMEEKLRSITRNFEHPDDCEHLFRFAYYLRGWRDAWRIRIFWNSLFANNTWNIENNYRVVSDLRDVEFANRIIREYFQNNDIIWRIESDNAIEFDMSDPIVWERSAWHVISDVYESLWETFILTRNYYDDSWVLQRHDTHLTLTQEQKWELIQMALWIQNYARFQTSDNLGYRELSMVDRFRISSLARFQRDTLWLLQEQVWLYNQYPQYRDWLEINESTDIAAFLMQEYTSHTYEDTVKAFWNQIWQNFNGRNRIDPQEIQTLTAWERNLLSLWADMNGYGGMFDFSDNTIGYMQTGMELAGLIAATAWFTILTGWLATYGWAAIWATRVARAGQVLSTNPYIQWMMMGWLSVPASRYMHPVWHDNLRERLIDLWSDYSVWILTWLLWWAISAKFWRQGAHIRNTSLNASDITLLWFWTEALRYMLVYNYLYGQEEFLWDGRESEWSDNQRYYSIDGVTQSPEEWEHYSSLPISP